MKTTEFITTFALLCASANAAVMIQPTGVTSNAGLFSTSYQLTNLINKDGLSASYTSGVTDYATYLAQGATQASSPLTQYAVMTDDRTTATFDFDLGGTFNLSHILLWNGPDSASTRVSTFTVSISASPTFTTSQNLGTFISDPDEAHPVSVEGFDLSTVGQGRYVRLSVTNDGGPRILLGEVAFGGEAIPEPSTLLVTALGALGLFRRCRA